MDWLLNIFPNGGGLGQSVITTVWVGIGVVCFLNLRFGFPLTGLVVPGYLVPLFIVSPTSATVILIEAVIVYIVMKLSAKTMMERFGFAEMFGRDRFFAIILISILVRVTMDTLFWPSIASLFSLWDITFDYAAQLYSLGLVIIALTANVMWNGGFRYGAKVTLIQLLLTYVIVRFILMPYSNFSIANLAIMYEAVAASIIAAPKAYIILVITAFIASRANIKYGWEFNGIMLPALLALQLMQPSKLLTSFAETAVILIIGSGLLHFTRLRHANFEGARLLLFFFNIGFVYKLLLNYVVVQYYPSLKVTDTFAFGYMLSTLLALKIYQKNALGLVIRATFQTSVVGGFIAIAIGFVIMFVPSIFGSAHIKELQTHQAVSGLTHMISEYKSYLYTDKKNQIEISQYQQGQQLQQFQSAVRLLNRDRQNTQLFDEARAMLMKLDFLLRQDEHYIYIQDARKLSLRGLFILTKQPTSELLITVPHPSSERLASDAAGLLLSHLNSGALLFGTQLTQSLSASSSSQQSKYYLAFINALSAEQILQVREINTRSQSLLNNSPFIHQCQLWAYNQLPNAISQKELRELLNCKNSSFGLASSFSLPGGEFSGQFLETFLDTANYTSLMSKVALADGQINQAPITYLTDSVENAIEHYIPHISAKGSEHFALLSDNEAALWEFEILRPLYILVDGLNNQTINANIQNRLNQINNIAQMVGYELTLMMSEQGRYIMIAPIPKQQFYEKGQGIFFINLNPAKSLNIQVPRPLFESNTLKFSAQLFTHIQGKVLSIAGAHPYASPFSNVMTPANVKSLFNIVHQSVLRHDHDKNIMNLQIRSHSAPSHIRPSAIAFQFTHPHTFQSTVLRDLRLALTKLGVEHQIVQGQTATRGLELGTSPQTGYQLFAPNSELATLWLASDFKKHFSISEQALLQRLLAISDVAYLPSLMLSTLAPNDWANVDKASIEKLRHITDEYAISQHLPLLTDYCKAGKRCTLQAVKLDPEYELALAIKNGGTLIALYLPTRNKLIDRHVYEAAIRRGQHVLY
ncbi:hypothetical protein J8L98_04515 [Pseudoalteromonas sp. MMG013]|uniref:poly-gamma-glutamate biosynthesis protein PgsC/CapC n=1 Tax=Pseudoalteromonas sp. MMG013 TaxID=2822687 RepID=UPI001B385C17|nr:poly-gamma-glutamate biosynthesis protein PgsC/CapC [Pseudoalteromonas sp. MMG013]MBQ4860961.1 hypothetical protein [Pseudoalteromonas sp. MMG013]